MDKEKIPHANNNDFILSKNHYRVSVIVKAKTMELTVSALLILYLSLSQELRYFFLYCCTVLQISLLLLSKTTTFCSPTFTSAKQKFFSLDVSRQ